VLQEVLLLCADDILKKSEDSIAVSEAESNIDNFRRWWDSTLTDLDQQAALTLDCIKEIVGK
jgi:hypothetical protein